MARFSSKKSHNRRNQSRQTFIQQTPKEFGRNTKGFAREQNHPLFVGNGQRQRCRLARNRNRVGARVRKVNRRDAETLGVKKYKVDIYGRFSKKLRVSASLR